MVIPTQEILWLRVKCQGLFVGWRGLVVDARRVVGGVVGDEGPGDFGEFASDRVEGSGLAQSLGLLARVASGKGAITGAAGRGLVMTKCSTASRFASMFIPPV